MKVSELKMECEKKNFKKTGNKSELINRLYTMGLQKESLDTPKKQRVVNKKLGKNIIKDHTKIYEVIEKRIGETKKCTFGHKIGSKTCVKHEGCQNVCVKNFELRGPT